MKNWILKLQVKYKLLFAFGSILLMSIILIVVGMVSIRKIIIYNNFAERIDAIKISSLEMSRYIQHFAEKGFKEESFLKYNKSELLDKYKSAVIEIEQHLDTLRGHQLIKGENQKFYKQLKKSLKQYQFHITQLLNIYQERGFKDYGVEGKLREAIHNVEYADYPYNKVTMLMLRRHEKDFFLRKDLKYQKHFNTTIEKFKSEINEQIDSANSKVNAQILSLVDQYRAQFNYIVSLEQNIGLNSEAGILGEMNATYKTIEQTLNILTARIKQEKETTINQSLITLLGLLAFQIISGLILVIVYANLLTVAIKEIKESLVSVSHGKFPDRLATRTKDEIAETKHALNNLVDRMRSAVQFATDLGKGNLKIEYDSRYNDDVLAQAIIKMKNQLVEADEQQAIINWSNEGLAQFSEILRNDIQDIEKLGDEIIAQMVKYLNVNQGALYILDSDKEELDRIAMYAYDKKKYVDDKIKVGQGLIGQCVLEQSYIYLKDVPANYINITSGLGEATPNGVLLMPLKIREQVMGVIELASFYEFSSDAIKFIEKAAENIASILSSKKTAELMKNMLAETQQKAEEMKAQEEEMRQNTEELHATQEELERQRKELLSHIDGLEAKLRFKEMEETI